MPHKKPKTQTNQLVGAIDQGTSSSRFLVGFLFGRNKYNKNNYF
jgi:glycerol kinase